jgi:hypothetical protein
MVTFTVESKSEILSKNKITEQNVNDLEYEKLIDFGQKFIENQINLDQDIFEIVDKNFSSLY